jgi:hypothetical protein
MALRRDMRDCISLAFGGFLSSGLEDMSGTHVPCPK